MSNNRELMLEFKILKAYKKYIEEVDEDICELFKIYIEKNNLMFKDEYNKNEITEEINLPSSALSNKLYKSLAIKLHPDKNKGETTKIFQEISNYHDKGDIESLYNIAKQNNICDDILFDDILPEIIQNNNKGIKKNTEKLYWKWYNCNDIDKKKLINNYFK